MGLYLLWGWIFPHDRLSQLVMVEDDSSPTGYGTRPLTRPELGELWDLPILLKDLVGTDTSFEASALALVRSPPVKNFSLVEIP